MDYVPASPAGNALTPLKLPFPAPETTLQIKKVLQFFLLIL